MNNVVNLPIKCTYSISEEISNMSPQHLSNFVDSVKLLIHRIYDKTYVSSTLTLSEVDSNITLHTCSHSVDNLSKETTMEYVISYLQNNKLQCIKFVCEMQVVYNDNDSCIMSWCGSVNSKNQLIFYKFVVLTECKNLDVQKKGITLSAYGKDIQVHTVYDFNLTRDIDILKHKLFEDAKVLIGVEA